MGANDFKCLPFNETREALRRFIERKDFDFRHNDSEAIIGGFKVLIDQVCGLRFEDI